MLFESVRNLDAARGRARRSPPSRVDGITVVELADRYDAAFTLATRLSRCFVTAHDRLRARSWSMRRSLLPARYGPSSSRAQRFFIVSSRRCWASPARTVDAGRSSALRHPARPHRAGNERARAETGASRAAKSSGRSAARSLPRFRLRRSDTTPRASRRYISISSRFARRRR